MLQKNKTKKTKDIGGLGEPETKGGRAFRLTLRVFRFTLLILHNPLYLPVNIYCWVQIKFVVVVKPQQ